MSSEVREETDLEMAEAIETVRRRLAKIRTGKASPALLDGIRVEYFSTPTPLNQLATVAAPEPRLLTVKPFDRSVIGDIEKAIQASNLGLNPANDGMMIRIQIPELTEERRRDFSKLAKEIGEDGKVAVRRARQEGNDRLKKMHKDGEISEDELHGEKAEIQKLTDDYCKQVDEITKAKEADIMEI
jgi:ribosome recycling factor